MNISYTLEIDHSDFVLEDVLGKCPIAGAGNPVPSVRQALHVFALADLEDEVC